MFSVVAKLFAAHKDVDRPFHACTRRNCCGCLKRRIQVWIGTDDDRDADKVDVVTAGARSARRPLKE